MTAPQIKKYPIDKTNFTVELIYTEYGIEPCICYKDIPLWRYGDGDLKDYQFFILKEQDKDYTVVTIACQDDWGDIYTYGQWKSVEECQNWLANPRRTY